MSELVRLYPGPGGTERPLVGTYLAHDLRSRATTDSRPYIYSNFVCSLDGRIAVPHPTREGLVVPGAVANERDWRLFQELAAQADLIITSGRYLRDRADGRAQEILQVDDPAFEDLRAWRRERGLAPHPDLAVISRSLAFPIPDVLTAEGRRVVVFTTARSDPSRVQEIEARAGQVLVAGQDSVDGRRMVQEMHALGYRLVYSASGPKVLHLLLAGDVLDRLYLTHVPRLLGGQPFSTIVEGALLPRPIDMPLRSLYLDRDGVERLGQLFACYDAVPASSGVAPPDGL